MNIIILALEFLVIFFTLVMFIGEKEDSEHWNTWNGVLIATILLMAALNFAMICRGISACFSCGSSQPIDDSTSQMEKNAKKAIHKYRWVKAGNTGEPPKTGGIFSFGDSTPDIDLKNFSDPDEAALFFDLTPAEITKQANDEARKIVKDRRTQEQEDRRKQIVKNIQAVKQEKEIATGPIPKVTDQEFDVEKVEARRNAQMPKNQGIVAKEVKN